DQATITPNYDSGSFSFTSLEPGSYDLTYQVTDGPNATTGLVRVDVTSPDDASGAPVVVTDTAMLPTGGKTLVDVLANDTDPAGGVLVVQSVQVPDDAGVSVAVLAHSVLRITELRTLDGPVTVQYTVSNGTETSTGQVRVVPVPAPTKLQPPNAAADSVTVHTGDVVTIPVLRNDTHPDGLELSVRPELAQGADPELGEAFVSENTVRFRAGASAGTAYAIYKVQDPNGQEDSAQVTIHVRDGQENVPPVPRDVETRVLSGASTRVDIPLDGIDPDGDSVQISGVASAPSQGTAQLVDGYVQYTASKNAVGLDTFTYTVLDARGATATGAVRVGISKPADQNQSPVAVDDEVTVRPDRTVAIAALRNDTDPDGDQIALVPSELDDSQGMDPEVVGDRVVVTTPADEGAYTFYYEIQDTYGARATGAITVDVAADAPLLPPVARDDAVQVEDVLGETQVPVAVLDNDDDPDGAASELAVTTDDETATVTDDGRLEITLTERRQVVTYTVTDIDGLTAKAFVTVPGLKAQAPTLRPGTSLEVQAGETLDIDITDHVLVAEGRTPRLTAEDTVKATDGSREVGSATEISYTPDEDYTGQAAVSFEVTDGAGPDDPDGNTALLTIPITVLPPENLPPELTTTPTLEVAAGEDASIDLARFATDPDGDDLTFTSTGQAEGVTTSLEGSTLQAQATPDVPKGTVVQVPITVSDGNNPPVSGEATLTVVASTRPLARANDDSVEDAHQGKETTVPVLANDSNPFPETPLQLLDAIVETGQGSVSVAGDQVSVTPREDYVGVMVVRYRVQDATKDPDREVEGRVQLTVLGKPEAPATPQVEEVRSETVVLSWDPPNNNGADITGYTVASQNGYTKECGTTTCTLDGLTNDVEYTFTVLATNDVGDGPASPPSAVARPDQKPDPPAAPSLEFGDKALTVSWTNKTYTDRSPIECVNLRISPAPAGASDKTCIKGTTYVWDGLENGTSYTVQVQAENDAPDPSDWGDASAPEIPAGKPDAPAAPNAARSNDNVNGGVIGVTWSTPFENGDAVKSYHLQQYKNGAADGGAITVTGKTAYTATGLDNEATYTYTVVAENKAGKGKGSGKSNQVIPYGKPGKPGRPSASLQSNTSQRAQVTFGAADANGNAVTYDVRANGSGGSTKKTTATTYTFTGLSNGSAYTFDVRACNDAGCSDWTARSGSVTPYTTPSSPGVKWTKTSATDGYFTVSGPSSDGGNAATVSWEFTNGQSGSGKGTGRVNVGGGYSKTYTVRARACNDAGCSGWVNDTGRTEDKPAPPPKTITASKGSNHKLPDSNGWPGNCQNASCAEVYLTIRNGPANTTFTSTCYGGGTRIGSGGYTRDAQFRTLRTDGSGNYEGGQQCIWGNPGSQVYVTTSIGTSTSYTWR
ncbi:fibronectin type III domain-containing protein, partial [Cellulosimicrobium arenosum]